MASNSLLYKKKASGRNNSQHIGQDISNDTYGDVLSTKKKQDTASHLQP